MPMLTYLYQHNERLTPAMAIVLLIVSIVAVAVMLVVAWRLKK